MPGESLGELRGVVLGKTAYLLLSEKVLSESHWQQLQQDRVISSPSLIPRQPHWIHHLWFQVWLLLPFTSERNPARDRMRSPKFTGTWRRNRGLWRCSTSKSPAISQLHALSMLEQAHSSQLLRSTVVLCICLQNFFLLGSWMGNLQLPMKSKPSGQMAFSLWALHESYISFFPSVVQTSSKLPPAALKNINNPFAVRNQHVRALICDFLGKKSIILQWEDLHAGVTEVGQPQTASN